MCGRYNLITDAQAIVDFFEVENSLEIEPRYNIAPSQRVPVIRQRGEGREISLLHWGLIPHWAKDKKVDYRMINARVETVAEKPSFRAAFRQRRCLIPATGFYEWQKVTGGKQPYNIQIGEGKLFAFAGLWERWKGMDDEVLESCSIIVTDVNDVVRPIHDRMPVILHPASYDTWLDPEVHDLAVLQQLLGPCPLKWITCSPVSHSVGSPANS